MEKRYNEIRASVCYDWKVKNELLVGHDGEWYIGVRKMGFGWTDVVSVSDTLNELDQERVRCMGGAGQVDAHIKAMETRKDFQSAVDELVSEAIWEERSRNYGKAESLRRLANQCRPLIDAVGSEEWLNAREAMSEVFSRMEP